MKHCKIKKERRKRKCWFLEFLRYMGKYRLGGLEAMCGQKGHVEWLDLTRLANS